MRLLSGVKSTNKFHLGNVPEISNFVQKQKSHQCLLLINDFPQIITPHQLNKSYLYETLAVYLAYGMDADRTIVFNQTSIPLQSHFRNLLSKYYRFDSNRVEDGSFELSIYDNAVFMAIDTLLYKSTHIPVTNTQFLHYNLSHQIFDAILGYEVGKFALPLPEFYHSNVQIMSLRNAKVKMSTITDSDNCRINLTDSADVIAKKIQKAKTDNDVLPYEVSELKDRHEVRNLVSIMAILKNKTRQEILDEFACMNFSQFKPILTDYIINSISPFSNEIANILQDESYLDSVLSHGSDKANVIARTTFDEVIKLLGLNQFQYMV